MMNANARFVAVIDIGKTNAKVVLIDLNDGSEAAVYKTANTVTSGPPYPHFDIDRLFAFILDALQQMVAVHGVDAVSITTHGATAALVASDGSLTLPVLDYEFNGPDETRKDYEALRPPFDETGSPPLPIGLNLGSQLYWQARHFPDAFARTKWILMYPQYWALRLTGVAASEATSLGCHTDLWNPWERKFSTLVEQSQDKMGEDWQPLFPPMALAGDCLGAIKPEIATLTGLAPSTPVYCGIHDSNASLLPYLSGGEVSFAVVSTGTWIVSMAIGGHVIALDPARDTLVNVNAQGNPTPTARFMGGREFDMLTGGAPCTPTDVDLRAVLRGNIKAMPSVQQGSGPFPDRSHHWFDRAPENPAEMHIAAAFYCALMTATCLDLIGATGPIFVEGPFSQNQYYLAMLQAATKRDVRPNTGGSTGTGLGAVMLIGQSANYTLPTPIDLILSNLEAYENYAIAYKILLEKMTSPF